MITKIAGNYYLACDCCDTAVECDDYESAVAYGRQEGWRALKYGTDWYNYCPDCKEGLDG